MSPRRKTMRMATPRPGVLKNLARRHGPFSATHPRTSWFWISRLLSTAFWSAILIIWRTILLRRYFRARRTIVSTTTLCLSRLMFKSGRTQTWSTQSQISWSKNHLTSAARELLETPALLLFTTWRPIIIKSLWPLCRTRISSRGRRRCTIES